MIAVRGHIQEHFCLLKNPLAPSISAVGPREVEVGKTYRFNGTAKPSWGSGRKWAQNYI